MQIQKLAYFGHGWHLAFSNEPLLDERVEAWTYGPVVPTLYHEFKEWGSGSIKKPATTVTLGVSPKTGRKTLLRFVAPSLDDAGVPTPTLTFTKQLLEKTWEVYGSLTGIALSQLTHEAGGPWERARSANPGVRGVDIPDDWIRDHFRAKMKANKGKAQAPAHA